MSAAWILIALIMAAQNALGGALRDEPEALTALLTPAFVQTLPWIPASLAVIYLAARFPLGRGRWRRHGPIHILAVPVVAFGVNLLVVLGYWLVADSFENLATLVRQAGFWTALRLHIVLLVYAAITAGTQGVLYYRDARRRELHLARVEAQLARARLQALNAQIRPHFLFNTLHTIGQLWRSGRSADADSVLDHLGELFHRVQSSASSPEIPLSDELRLVRDYLAIERMRFRDRMRTEVHASDDALACLVPPLLLQPLVENAVRHGISAVSSAGVVEVRATVERGRLRVTVRDDGPGFPGGDGAGSDTAGSGAERDGRHADGRPTVDDRHTGTGLRNTRERLAQLYGEAALLSIESDAGAGTTVRVELPARTVATERSTATSEPRRTAPAREMHDA